MPDNQTDVSELARQVVDELDPGTTIGDKVILSRRQFVAAAGSTLSVGALMSFGVSEADAQEAVGQVGTPDSPEDIYGATGDFSQDVTVDGALDADDATIGDVDGFWGGSGKQIILDRSAIMPAGSYSGTNTTYETLNNPEDRSVLDWSVIDYGGISQYNVAFSTYQLRQEGDVVNCEVRIGSSFGDAPETLDGTLIDTTDDEVRPIGVSEDVDLSNFGVWTPQIEARTEAGGEWNIRGQPTVSLIGVID